MTGANDKQRKKRDVSGWKSAPQATVYRSVIRKAEKLAESNICSENQREEVQDALYGLKCALVDGLNEGILNRYEEKLLQLMEEDE